MNNFDPKKSQRKLKRENYFKGSAEDNGTLVDRLLVVPYFCRSNFDHPKSSMPMSVLKQRKRAWKRDIATTPFRRLDRKLFKNQFTIQNRLDRLGFDSHDLQN